jgi:hypothetical protein
MGVTYMIIANDRSTERLVGTAAFASSNPVGGGGGTDGGGFTYTGGFPGDSAGGRAFATSNSQFLRMQASSGILVSEDGVLQYAGSGSNRVAIGGGEAVDVAGDADLVVGRYVGNQVVFNDRRFDFPSTGGVSYLVHSGFTGQLPVSGTIDYEVYAATQPVFSSGSVEPGMFDANLTIGFGSSLSVGIDGTITMPEANGAVAYDFATAGRESGALRPLARDFNGELSFSTALSGNGGACSSGDCTIFFTGAFAGAGAGEKVGFMYQTADNRNFGTAEVIQGGAAFRAVGTQTNPNAQTSNTIAMAQPRPAVSVPVTTSASAMPADWSRWAGGAVAGGQMAGRPETTSSIGWIAPESLGIEGRADGADRRAAIRQAEQLMGGLITFPGASPDQR